MAEVKLKLKNVPDVVIEAESITPDNFAGKSADEIKKITVFLGNQEVPLGDLFDVSGTAGEKDDTKIIIDSLLDDGTSRWTGVGNIPAIEPSSRFTAYNVDTPLGKFTECILVE